MNALKDIRDLSPVMREAGRAILDVYDGDIKVETKADNSPLTEADRRANTVITRFLADNYPQIPVISEETQATPYPERKSWECFWLVDPLDGTKEFIKRNGEFTVNVALIEHGTPVAGFVYQPVGEISYFASRGQGAFRQTDSNPPQAIRHGMHFSELENVRVVASRSHQSPEVMEFVEKLKADGKTVDLKSSGSSLKLCLVASGEADVYPRYGPTMEWDTAAAHAVAIEAGCSILSHPDRKPLVYNKENLLNPWFTVE